MWNQWTGAVTTPMPPMPMTAAPPQPAAPPLPDAPPPPPPSNAIVVPSTSFIGPLQPSATMSTGASITTGNPYEQYTAAQYAAMTPEQQYALQQHWQQWQTYQHEYAKWHAQYGEQYKREMAAAAASVSNPVASTPNAYMTPYYPQAPTSAQPSIQQTPLIHQPPLPQAVRPQANRKIMGQPQMYAQPPPAAAQQHTQWTPHQQMPSELNMVPVNYNQPPPTFNTHPETSKFNIGNMYQEQKMSHTSLHDHKADSTSGAESNSQWQNPLPIQNKSGSSMWSSADNQKQSNEKSNSGNPNLWPQSSQNRGKPTNFENNRVETYKDVHDAGSLLSPRKPQNIYVSPNKCDEGVNNNESNAPEKRFMGNNPILSDFDKDRSNKFGNNNFGNNGPRNFGKTTKFENNASKSYDNKTGQNPFCHNFGNLPLNNFVNSEQGDFDDGKSFGNQTLPNFGLSNNSNGSKNFDNNVPDRFNNSGSRYNQGWNQSDFNNQSDNNHWDNDAKTNQNFSPGGSINNFNSSGGSFNRPTGTNPRNVNRSNSWQQQTTRKPELDDASFDRMFEQWEKQFEDWKRANINHPDREEYRRYEQEFEKQRRRIMERREQMRRRRMAQMSANFTATTNTDFMNLNQSEEQLQEHQPLHQQQSQQIHEPQQLIQEQHQSWSQQSQFQGDEQKNQEMVKPAFDMEDQRRSPIQRKITETHNKDTKSNKTNIQSLNEISQTLKQTQQNTSKNQTSQDSHTLQRFQAKPNTKNQEFQQNQTLQPPNQTQQVAMEDSIENKQPKSSQDEKKKPEQQQEEGDQKQSQNQQNFIQKQIQQNTDQREGTQHKQNQQGPHQKQYQSNTNQSLNQQEKSTRTSLQQKQNQSKLNPPLKSNQQTPMLNLNEQAKLKGNEQKLQHQQEKNQQSPQRIQNLSQKLNQTPQKHNLSQNQNSLEQKQQTPSQVQGSTDEANTPKLNQLKPLPQRQLAQQRRQAQHTVSAANKLPQDNKTDNTNDKTLVNETPSAIPDQKVASGSLLGKRKSRFNPQDDVKEKKEAKPSDVIILDDDDDDVKAGAGNNEGNSVNSIFKKSEGIPGLDLVDESESRNLEEKNKSADTKPGSKNHDVGGGCDDSDVIKRDRTLGNVTSKIPSLFDVVIEKPPDLPSPPPLQQLSKNVDNSALMAQLQTCNLDSIANVADALKDPQFLQQISLAVARVQGHDVPSAPSPQLLEQLPGLLQQMQQQQQHSPTAIGSSYRSDRLYLNEAQRPMNATPVSSKEKCLPTHLLQQQQIGNEGISAPLSFVEWQRRKTLASNDGPNMFGPSLGNNGSQNFNDNTPNFGNSNQNFRNDGPNMFGNNGLNNFGNNDANRYNNNFRNDQMMNPNDLINRRNFGPSGNNNNGGPCLNRGINLMSAGGGPFNKNNCFGDNPFRRSGGLPPAVLDDNVGGGRGTFSGLSGGFDNSGGGGFGEMIGRFSDPGCGGLSGAVGGGGFGGHGGEQSNMDFMRRGTGNNNARSVGPEKNEGFYRPIQVFDYQNSSAPTPKVIDYGHKHSTALAPMEIAANKSECNANVGVDVGLANEYKPVKTFEYGHASNPNVKAIAKNFTPSLSKNAIKKRNRKKNKLLRLQQQQLPTLKGSYNSQQHQQQQQQSHQEAKDDAGSAGSNEVATALQKLAASSASGSKLIEANIISDRKGDKSVDLEDISDTDEIDTIDNSNNTPAAPPPPSLSLTSKNSTDHSKYQLAIFPSTSNANEQITSSGSAKHLQMSIPTMENCNTVAIDEILEKPGRLTRPKRICIILRGPPGSGKSYVAKLIKEKETEMGGANTRILSIDDYFLIENDYEEKCSKTGKKIPKKEILYEYDDAMEETYMQYLIKSFKKTITDNLYDFIIVDCNNNSLRTLNEFYCHAKDSGFMPYIVDLFCDLETCLGRNPHDRSERDIKDVIDNWCETPFHYIKLNVSLLLENVIEMEDVENMATDEISNESVEKASAVDTMPPNTTVDEGDDSNGIEGATQCGFLKSKWESDNTSESLERLDGTNKLQLHKRNTTSMADYLQLDDWQPRATSSNCTKRVRWADIEEKRKQEEMRAIGFVVGQTDWKRMMDPNAGNRALNRTKFIERVNKRR